MIKIGSYILWINDPYHAKTWGEYAVCKVLKYNKDGRYNPEYTLKFPEVHGLTPQVVDSIHVEHCKIITKEKNPEYWL